MKFFKSFLCFSVLLLFFGTTASADSAPGDVIVTLGENLSSEQKEKILAEMSVNELNTTIITVSNKEERDYLGKFISPAQIGTKALSSSKITLGEEGYGLHVQTANINWVSEEMYKNALMTAGVKDADIYVTAPFPVSGTAGLTGLLKAYETTMDIEIPEEQKEVANEELIKTAELGDSVGDQKATELINLIKLKMGELEPKTEEEIRNIIKESATQLGIQLTDEEIDGLVSLFKKMQELDIDWNAVGEQLNSAKEKFENFINDPETQNWIEKIGEFFKSLIDAIMNMFGGTEKEK